MSKVLIRKPPPQLPPPPGPPDVTWTEQSITVNAHAPGWTGFTSLHCDPVNERIVSYLTARTQSTIYATGIHDYQTNANTWTRYGGTDNTGAAATSSLQPYPGARHPVIQMATDTLREGLWIFNGVFNGDDRDDFWFWDFNTHTFEEIAMSVVPTGGTRDGLMVYVPGLDVLLLFGQHTPSGLWEGPWIIGLSDPLTADQLTAGCVTPMVWVELTSTGMPVSAYPYFINGGWDPVLERVIITGGHHYVGGSGTPEGIKKWWEYAPLTKAWTERVITGLPAATLSQSCEQHLIRIGSGTWEGQWWWHRTGEPDAPNDFLIDPETVTMTELDSTGLGPEFIISGFQWDPWAGKAVALSYKGSSQLAVWHGALA